MPDYTTAWHKQKIMAEEESELQQRHFFLNINTSSKRNANMQYSWQVWFFFSSCCVIYFQVCLGRLPL